MIFEWYNNLDAHNRRQVFYTVLWQLQPKLDKDKRSSKSFGYVYTSLREWWGGRGGEDFTGIQWRLCLWWRRIHSDSEISLILPLMTAYMQRLNGSQKRPVPNLRATCCCHIQPASSAQSQSLARSGSLSRRLLRLVLACKWRLGQSGD